MSMSKGDCTSRWIEAVGLHSSHAQLPAAGETEDPGPVNGWTLCLSHLLEGRELHIYIHFLLTDLYPDQLERGQDEAVVACLCTSV